jgi:UDP-N-acetylmuramate dehydrogenase
MHLEDRPDLKPYNTFGVPARARLMARVESAEDLMRLWDDVQLAQGPRLILGGGSNLLLTGDFDGLVLKNEIRGHRVAFEDRDHVRVRSGGGEDWPDFVQWCLAQGYYGLENLVLIPGTVGASPVQNVGAYGVEVGPRVVEVEAMDLVKGCACRFAQSDCRFGYRTSRFKEGPRDRFLITAVTFRLDKQPRVNLTYAELRETLRQAGIEDPSPAAVAETVGRLRRGKLPDPQSVGNAGSFFKNPVVSRDRWAELKARHPDLPAYPDPAGGMKLAAGWLIERCGWKGRRVGRCGVWDRQALVLVNHGGATGAEILDLARQVMESVAEVFGIRLDTEVRIV